MQDIEKEYLRLQYASPDFVFGWLEKNRPNYGDAGSSIQSYRTIDEVLFKRNDHYGRDPPRRYQLNQYN